MSTYRFSYLGGGFTFYKGETLQDAWGRMLADKSCPFALEALESVAMEESPIPSTGQIMVKLTYFKESGKYYSEGFFEMSADTPLFDAAAMIRDMMVRRELPGLVKGCSEFSVLANFPGHKHDHPMLFHPRKNEDGPAMDILEEIEEKLKVLRDYIV